MIMTRVSARDIVMTMALFTFATHHIVEGVILEAVETPADNSTKDPSKSARFEKLCSDSILDTGEDSPTRSTIDCARSCLSLELCVAFAVYTDSNNQLFCRRTVESNVNCDGFAYHAGAKVFANESPPAPPEPAEPECYSWRLVFNTTIEGVATYGSVDDLITMVTQGFPVRIGIRTQPLGDTEEYTLYNADSVWVANGVVTAQAFTWAKPFGAFGSFNWIVVHVSSDGPVLFKSTMAPHEVVGRTTGTDWYVKNGDTVEMQSGVVLEWDADGNVIQGDLNGFVQLLYKGYQVTMTEKRLEKVIRSFSASWIGHDINTGKIGMANPSVYEYSSFNSSVDTLTNEIVTFAMLAGGMSLVSYKNYDVMNDGKEATRVIHDNIGVSLTVDVCWEEVYTHVEADPQTGSFADLKASVAAGRDIRVMYTCETMSEWVKIKRIVVQESTIFAYTGRTFTLPLFPADLNMWYEVEINTDGFVIKKLLNRTDDSITYTDCSANISWFAEISLSPKQLFTFQDPNDYSVLPVTVVPGTIPGQEYEYFYADSSTLTVVNYQGLSFNMLTYNYGTLNGTLMSINYQFAEYFQVGHVTLVMAEGSYPVTKSYSYTATSVDIFV